MKMKNLLKLEEVGQFILAILLFSRLEYAWWVFPVFILVPDLSMVGYLVNTRIGAWLYNLFHHKLLAVLILLAGYGLNDQLITLIGLILFGHAAMDRIFGYGLKFADDFKHTHLGWIGKESQIRKSE